jgi:hypothetical protein
MKAVFYEYGISTSPADAANHSKYRIEVVYLGNALDLFEQQNLQWDWVTVPTLEMIRFCIH